MPFALWLRRHYGLIWWLIFGLCSMPLLQLLLVILQFRPAVINPLQYLQQWSGFWALSLLLITLSITPLRRLLARLARWRQSRYGKRLSDWNWIIRTRRMLGLWCFAYASVHLGVYLHFDLGYDWSWLKEDIEQKPFVVLGLLSWLLLLLLALTSNDASMRRLGKHWRRLHRLIYLINILVILHYWWAVKHGSWMPMAALLATLALLGYRLLCSKPLGLMRSRDDGMEAPERPSIFDTQ